MMTTQKGDTMTRSKEVLALLQVARSLAGDNQATYWAITAAIDTWLECSVENLLSSQERTRAYYK